MRLATRLEKERLLAFKPEVWVYAKPIDGLFTEDSETEMILNDQPSEGFELLATVVECLNYLEEDAGGDPLVLIDLFNDIREV